MKAGWAFFFFLGWSMKQRILGLWRQILPKVKVGGVWKDVDVGWIKQNGVFRKFKYPFVTAGETLSLYRGINTRPDGSQFERRSFIRGGNGPAVGGVPGAAIQGSLTTFKYNVDGLVWDIRGIETGSDVVGGVAAWKWVSLQWFGSLDSNKLARVIYLNGHTAIFKTGGYNPDFDMTFLTYELIEAHQFPFNTNLSIRF